MSSAMSGSIKFMTYNVWSSEHVAVYRRIKAICEIIEQHDPDVIFLQEVTSYIETIFREAPWWRTYKMSYTNPEYNCSPNPPAFSLVLSKMDVRDVPSPKYSSYMKSRAGSIASELRSAWVYTEQHRLRAGTCRLASPTPSDAGCKYRRARARDFLVHLDAVVVHQQPGTIYAKEVLDENVVVGGDLGWDDDLDGPLRLRDGGWVDAWLELRGGEAGGWTYDAHANPMVRGLNLPEERRRPDRFICKLRDFTLESIEMLGLEAIPGVTRMEKGYSVPVLPSHHFGLLLTIKPKDN